MKGFFAGVFLGTIVVAFGLAVLSEIAPMPVARVAAAGTESRTGAEPPKLAVVPKVAPAARAAPATPVADDPAPPVVAVTPALIEPALVEPALVEDVADPLMDLPRPAAVAVAEGPAAPIDAVPPVTVVAPKADAGPVLAELTPPPVAKPAVEEVTGPADDAAQVATGSDPAGVAPPATSVEGLDADRGTDAADGPVAVADDTPPLPAAADTAPVAEEADATPPAAVATPPVSAVAAADALVVLPVPDTPPARGVSAEPVVVAEPPPGPAPTPGLDGNVDGVTTGRLPRIAAAEPAPGPVVAPVDATPLARFARDFDNPDGKPAFAIVLIDQGLSDADRKRLAALPFPVTFAIDPAMPQAAGASAIYRAAGQEVAMLATGIPEGATAADLEVTFAAHARALPEAVVVLDLESGGFQGNRVLATQVVPVIAGQGRGVVTWEGGLNAGSQVAQRDGVAAGTVFRRFDPEGASVPTMRRTLDRAAFKAAQDGRVIVVGNASAAMTVALLAWSLEGRASSVALAPVSAVLTKPAG